MLFNSYAFLLAFLPLALLGYFACGRFSGVRTANAWLLLLSLFFYSYWDVRYLPLLLVSIAGNYLLASAMLRAGDAGRRGWKRAAFAVGLLFNLGLLGYFKYLGFFIQIFDDLGAGLTVPQVVLPLGISFFTITQLLYLYDCYAGARPEHRILDYALFVSFFPHLLAGPILYHRQMMRQFRDAALHVPDWHNLSAGLTLFLIGLLKKVVIADALSPYVGAGFSQTAGLSTIAAWLTLVSYALQLYFDFSGYSDMAVGLSRMMNFAIPVNFRTPYRATSLVNFWQRWHISLTNALTACVYMPCLRAFSRPDLRAVVVASFVTIFLVGIWHGAGWTFVVFALIHAVGVVCCHLWRRYGRPLPSVVGWLLTQGCFALSLVFFRAEDLSSARAMLAALCGLHGTVWPAKLAAAAQQTGLSLAAGDVPGALPKAVFAVALGLVLFAPGSNELLPRLRPRWYVALAFVAGGAYVLLELTQPTEFLYFQF